MAGKTKTQTGRSYHMAVSIRTMTLAVVAAALLAPLPAMGPSPAAKAHQAAERPVGETARKAPRAPARKGPFAGQGHHAASPPMIHPAVIRRAVEGRRAPLPRHTVAALLVLASAPPWAQP